MLYVASNSKFPGKVLPFTLVPFTPPWLPFPTPTVTPPLQYSAATEVHPTGRCPEAGVPGPALLGWFFLEGQGDGQGHKEGYSG